MAFLTEVQGILSAVVPIYRTEYGHLERCLRSLGGQSWRSRTELVLVNDGSNWNEAYRAQVRSLLDEMRDELYACSLITVDRNIGYPAARNVGVGAATGEWILLLDSDDYVLPTLTEKILSAATSTAKLIYADHIVLPESPDSAPLTRRKSLYQQLHEKHWGTIADPLLSCTYIFHPQVFRRSTLIGVGGFHRTPFGGEEVAAHLTIGGLSESAIVHVPDVLYAYCPSATSVTSDVHFYDSFILKMAEFMVEGARVRGLDVGRAVRMGRAQATHAAHYRLYNNAGREIDIPWFDYSELRFRCLAVD
jgi:Glycosyl transferase family 2